MDTNETGDNDFHIQANDENPSETISYVVPYKNPKALIAYYLGIASGIPFVGLPVGIAAFILGVKGLKDRKRDPKIRGSAHAWIGIGCGGFFAILWAILLFCVILAIASSP